MVTVVFGVLEREDDGSAAREKQWQKPVASLFVSARASACSSGALCRVGHVVNRGAGCSRGRPQSAPLACTERTDSFPLDDGILPVTPLLAPEILSLGPLGVTAAIRDATVPGGVLTPPIDVTQVGKWVDGAPLDSDSGTVLIAGHVNMTGQGHGALFILSRMQSGDYVHTSDAQGAVTAWRVTSVVGRPKSNGIGDSVLDGPEGPRRSAVVNCGGDLAFTDGVIGDYEDNIYLYADRVS